MCDTAITKNTNILLFISTIYNITIRNRSFIRVFAKPLDCTCTRTTSYIQVLCLSGRSPRLSCLRAVYSVDDFEYLEIFLFAYSAALLDSDYVSDTTLFHLVMSKEILFVIVVLSTGMSERRDTRQTRTQ